MERPTFHPAVRRSEVETIIWTESVQGSHVSLVLVLIRLLQTHLTGWKGVGLLRFLEVLTTHRGVE